MINIKEIIQNNQIESLALQGTFGIEKEGIRVIGQKLALTDHPALLGDRAYHPYIQTDFSEAQLELVTPPQSSLEEAFSWLQALNDVVQRSVQEEEYIWPFSMPAILPEPEDIPIIRVKDQKEVQYREKLADKYGKKKQLISGIHYNFAFSDLFIKRIYENQTVFSSFQEVKDELHLKMARNFLRYQWILTYLYGASPYADTSFYRKDELNTSIADPMRSVRNSAYGYHNTNDITVHYDSLEDYVEDIERFVADGILSEEREFYGAARIRGKGKEISFLNKTGVEYVEFRPFDLNPFDELGITKKQAEFIHLFFVLMIWLEDTKGKEQILEGTRKNERTAAESPFDQSEFYEEGLTLLETMQEMASHLKLDREQQKSIEEAIDAFNDPSKTLAAQLAEQIDSSEQYLAFGEMLGRQYKRQSFDKPYLTRGFEEMEMSTQLLIFDALQKGLKIEILDKQDQFLKLQYRDHEEYVKNGNMTAQDTYISHWIMENKTVTKKILKSKGFNIPEGEEFQSVDEAMAAFELFKNQEIVVKPKSTNYGLGISVFKQAPKAEDFKEALDIAFKEDQSVLVEEYAAGTEYRFFVLNGEVKAVLLRVPANVKGDGRQTVEELIDQKNADPLRGRHHRAPLEKIQKGNIEKLMLKEQNYTLDSVPNDGEIVYLRENSNISTGGDSIDFTDKMHDSYKKLASEMAEQIKVKVTGIDLIIPDYTKESTEREPGYTVIEANFNPAMHMHTYVSQGKGRRLTIEILKMLFPELY
ncbi:bifunctional glutamate--cysteine ligase GshA/glutathione synthetase GshB [Marinilactibacillus piezotolerans]|uniref:bifunctional glutamate--cysteine ligase GshA/glutathione synthetase GshB n=1 Tax=Marinilactibacillus piezotolerans TaxID=258723 RepID=UPI0009B07929|nr:bifunctional glutamate--cysteine ligase GshA/glutathione synthetase GshB [Marinilactibacillus piezotolerans]